MLEIEREKYIFRIKEIWFSDYPFDVRGFVSVFFIDCKNEVNTPGFIREKSDTLIIDLTQDLDTIFKNMNKACRYDIRRSEKEGFNIKMNQNYGEFYNLNQSFRKSKKAPLDFTEIEFMKKYGTLFIAELNGEILVGNFYLEDEKNIRYRIGASKRLEVNNEKAALIGRASKLMQWEAIKYAKAKGIKEFDFGGYYTGAIGDKQREGINIFKKSFGGKLVTHYIYRKDYSRIYKFIKGIYRISSSLFRI